MYTEQQHGDLSDLTQGLVPDAQEAGDLLKRVAVNIKEALEAWELGSTIEECAEYGFDLKPIRPESGQKLAWVSLW